MGSPRTRNDRKESEGSEISVRDLQEKSNETKPEVMIGVHVKGTKTGSNTKTATYQTSVHIPKNRCNQKGSEGSALSAGGLQVQSNETNSQKEVTTRGQEKNKIVWSNVPSPNKRQPAAHVATSSFHTTALGFAVCIPQNKDNRVRSDGSEISTGGLHDGSKETKPEVMTAFEEPNRIGRKNLATHNKCQAVAHVATASSQTTGSPISTGELHDPSHETKSEVMTGAHEKHRIVRSNVPTANKCQPVAHVATSSFQNTALGLVICMPENREDQVITEGPEVSARGLQSQINKIKPEVMTGAGRNMPAADLASSSSQTTALAVAIPEDTQKVIDEGLAIPSKGLEILQNQISDINLEVVTGADGNARIIWSNIPSHLKKQDMMVVLFKNNEQDASKSYIGNRISGTYDTSVPLNDGLQARLLTAKKLFFIWKEMGQEICRSNKFKNPDPVNITGYEARLQLFVRDGKARVRLYVKKSFREWKSEFSESWVGFYASADKKT